MKPLRLSGRVGARSQSWQWQRTEHGGVPGPFHGIGEVISKKLMFESKYNTN